MQRWRVSLGLAALAVVGVVLAPRLVPTTPRSLPPPRSPTLTVVPAAVSGSLTIDAGLDQPGVLADTEAERFLVIRVATAAGSAANLDARRPVDVGVVLDASGSMSAQGKIDYAKRAATVLAAQVRPSDSYSLVTFSDHAQVVVPATHNADPHGVGAAVDGIYEGGGTNLYAGMEGGAEQIRSAMAPGNVGRLIVLSDGKANAGVTSPHAFTRFAASLASQGVTVSTVGLGLDYNEDLLARIADMGGGTYDFVDEAAGLEAVFRDELDAAASVVARGVSLQITLPDGVEPVGVLGWEATDSASGWSVFLGDVYADDQRKVVARVRFPAGAGTERRVATVLADYQDVAGGALVREQLHVVSRTVADERAVSASTDRERAIDAHRAFANWYLDQSTRAYQRGDRPRSRALLDQGTTVLRRASDALASPELARERDALIQLGYTQQQHAPASVEGRRLIKGNKERFRDVSR